MGEMRMDGDPPVEAPTPAETTDEVIIQNGEAKVVTEDVKEQLLAGKYKSVAELERGYQELQRKMSGGSQGEAAPDEPGVTDSGDDPLIINKSSGEENTAEGLIAEALQAGEDLPLDKLKKMGVSPSTAELIRQGIEAESSKFRSELYRVVEGKDNYGPISKWAAENADPDELEAYNRAVTSGDLPTARLLLRGLRAAYESSEASPEPSRIQGANTPRSTGVAPYESQAQMIADMNNPQYQEDPSFRKMVMERLRVSNII